MNARNFFAELKPRATFTRIAITGVMAWLLMQIASRIFPFFEIPN